jgi:hypothetical protein
MRGIWWKSSVSACLVENYVNPPLLSIGNAHYELEPQHEADGVQRIAQRGFVNAPAWSWSSPRCRLPPLSPPSPWAHPACRSEGGTPPRWSSIRAMSGGEGADPRGGEEVDGGWSGSLPLGRCIRKVPACRFLISMATRVEGVPLPAVLLELEHCVRGRIRGSGYLDLTEEQYARLKRGV